MPYLVIALLIALLGCSDTQFATHSDEQLAAIRERAASGQAERAMSSPPPAPTAPQSDAADPARIQDPASQPMLIRTGQVTIEVDSLEPAIAAVRAVAARVGGYVGATSTQGGDNQLRSATLELKIPSNRWSDAMTGLAPIGEVESVREEVQDVGEEFVDVTARLTNARRLEERLIELLARRTGKLEDVLMVERELNRVREEIERYEGRLRYLRSRVSTSTLVVALHEPAPIVGAPGENVLVEAFREAWSNFVHFIAWLISASGILIPLGLVVVALGWAGLRVHRAIERREQRSAPHRRPEGTPPADSP